MYTDILSGFLGAVVGATVSFLTLRYNYKDLYARNISANRMNWINNFREEISIIVAALKASPSRADKDKENVSFVFQAEKARAKLLTRLNMDTSKPGNEYNKVMAEILNSVQFDGCKDKQDHYVEVLLDLSRKILEPEWKRVKQEAGGDKK